MPKLYNNCLKTFMKKYEYVTIRTNSVLSGNITEHRDIIDEYALKGYRFAGFVPVYINSEGKIKEIDPMSLS